MPSYAGLAVLAALLHFTAAHTVITYPGWRGDNLQTNGTPPNLDASALGINVLPNGSRTYPYGMQWMYPCGGLPQPENRTKWPISGGAVGFQPGWFQGHSLAQLYINIGINGPGDVAPPNMSHNILKNVQISGPSNNAYPNESICFPQLSMPANITFNVGDNITIQVVEAAQHGAALFSCVDVTLAADGDPEIPLVTPQNCWNNTTIGFNTVYSMQSVTSGSPMLFSTPTSLAALGAAFVACAFAALI